MMTHFGNPCTFVLLSTLLGASTLFGVNGKSDTNVGSEYSRANDVDIIQKKKDMPIHLTWTKEPVNKVKKHLSKLHIQTNEKDKHRRDDIKKDEEIEWKKNDTAEGIDHHDITTSNKGFITHDSLASFEAMMKQHASMTRIGTRRRRNNRRHLQNECIGEIEELIFCGGREQCFDCILETTERGGNFSGCSDLEEYFCEELSDCESSCGSSCMDETFDVMDCIFESIDETSSCALAGCPETSEEVEEEVKDEDEDEDENDNPSDEQPDCFPEALATFDCGIPDSCAECALEALTSRLLFIDCFDFENHLCQELSYCELQCGASCMDELAEWVECSFQTNDDFALCSLMDCPWL